TLMDWDLLQPQDSSNSISAEAAHASCFMMGKLHSTGSEPRKAAILQGSPKGATLRVGMIGTGAISNLHARAYRNIGYSITVCTDVIEEAGRRFAQANGAEFVKTYEEVCRHPEMDYVDVCTFPDFRLQPLRICAEAGKHV